MSKADMPMITFDHGGRRFNFRVAAVIAAGGRILLHRATYDNQWSLPGGRVELMETAAYALQREIVEELGVTAEIGNLRWVVDDFYHDLGYHVHELCLYFDAHLPSDAPFLTADESFPTIEAHKPLIFRWFTPGELASLPLVPPLLRERLWQTPGPVEYLSGRS
jgi:8-oxo-dGTP pyrophosphatase MutT (NUDIX family)